MSDLLPITLDPAWMRAFVDWFTNLASPRTRRTYMAAWRDFLAFRPVAPAKLTQSDLLSYRHHMEHTPSPRTGQPYSDSTINHHMCALSSFFSFAVARGLRSDNPCEGVKRKRVSPYGRATWLDGEQEQDIQLLRVVDTSSIQGKRDYAILLLFLTTALRVEAVASLRGNALRYQGKKLYLTYTNKGGELVEKLLEPLTANAIVDYLVARLEDTPLEDNAPLFVATPRGRKASAYLHHTSDAALAGDKPLTSRSLNNIVKRYCDMAFGPGHGITPHSLRHTAAMNAIIEGASVTEISQLLKHKNIGVTTVYLHATGKEGDRVSRKLGRRYARHLEDKEDEAGD